MADAAETEAHSADYALTVGSLFSGIGGVDMGLERAGMIVRWQSEVDPYACRVLARHWPTVPNLGDVTKIEWSEVEPVDIICGGYPCQPFSLAGVRRGEHDDRHLWPYFADAIRHLRPRWALLENVPGHLSMGFGRVLGDLAELGFDAEWESIPAAAVGAPHLRYRVFVVAYAQRVQLRNEPVTVAGSRRAALTGNDGTAGPMADTEGVSVRAGLRSDGPGGQRRGRPGDCCGPIAVADTEGERRGAFGPDDSRQAWADHVARHAGQLPGAEPWPTEPGMGRVADGVPDRVDRLRCLGNAVVPQVAQWIGERIVAADGGQMVTVGAPDLDGNRAAPAGDAGGPTAS